MLITNIKSIYHHKGSNIISYNLNHWKKLKKLNIHIYNHSVKLKIANKPGGIQ